MRANQAQAPIEDVGTPEGILSSLGAYITGNYLDEDDVSSFNCRTVLSVCLPLQWLRECMVM
jgi:hypothetical protein